MSSNRFEHVIALLPVRFPYESKGNQGALRQFLKMNVWKMPLSKYKGLRRLLIFHGFITLAAAVVLTVAPGVIPGAVGIHLGLNAYMVAYLLAGAEFGFAVLSFGGSRLVDPQALRLVAWSCIAFHASSGVLELYAYAQRKNVLVLGNVAARIIIVALFAYLSRRGPK